MNYFYYKELSEKIEFIKCTASDIDDIVKDIENENADRYTARRLAQIGYDIQTKLEELENIIRKRR